MFCTVPTGHPKSYIQCLIPRRQAPIALSASVSIFKDFELGIHGIPVTADVLLVRHPKMCYPILVWIKFNLPPLCPVLHLIYVPPYPRTIFLLVQSTTPPVFVSSTKLLINPSAFSYKIQSDGVTHQVGQHLGREWAVFSLKNGPN